MTPLQEMTRVTNQQMPSQVAHMSPASHAKASPAVEARERAGLELCSQLLNALEHSLAVPSVSLAVAGRSKLVASLRRVDSLKEFPRNICSLGNDTLS